MPRPTVLIDKSQLEQVIKDLESKQTFSNLSALCKSVCETDWAKSIKNSVGKDVVLQPQVVYNRIEEFKLQLNTKPGKKGRAAGVKVSGVRRSRSEKFSQNPLVQATIEKLRQDSPKSEGKLIDKIEGGSIKAMVKAMCRNCVCYEQSLIGDKSCLGCPLSPIVFVNMKNYKKEQESDESVNSL